MLMDAAPDVSMIYIQLRVSGERAPLRRLGLALLEMNICRELLFRGSCVRQKRIFAPDADRVLSCGPGPSEQRPLPVPTSTRADAYPDLPTLAEAGLTGYELTHRSAVLAPAKTPPNSIATLNDAVRKALEDPEVRRCSTSKGGVPSPTSARNCLH